MKSKLVAPFSFILLQTIMKIFHDNFTDEQILGLEMGALQKFSFAPEALFWVWNC
jgi:hypothetical protein